MRRRDRIWWGLCCRIGSAINHSLPPRPCLLRVCACVWLPEVAGLRAQSQLAWAGLGWLHRVHRAGEARCLGLRWNARSETRRGVCAGAPDPDPDTVTHVHSDTAAVAAHHGQAQD